MVIHCFVYGLLLATWAATPAVASDSSDTATPTLIREAVPAEPPVFGIRPFFFTPPDDTVLGRIVIAAERDFVEFFSNSGSLVQSRMTRINKDAVPDYFISALIARQDSQIVYRCSLSVAPGKKSSLTPLIRGFGGVLAINRLEKDGNTIGSLMATALYKDSVVFPGEFSCSFSNTSAAHRQPLPALSRLLKAAASFPFRTSETGLSYRTAEDNATGISATVWLVDPDKFSFEIVRWVCSACPRSCRR